MTQKMYDPVSCQQEKGSDPYSPKREKSKIKRKKMS